MCQGSSLFLPFPTTRESNILNLVSHLYYISHQPQPTVPGPYASCSALTRHLDLLYANSCFAFADSLSVTFLFIPSCSLTVACFDFALPHPCPVCLLIHLLAPWPSSWPSSHWWWFPQLWNNCARLDTSPSWTYAVCKPWYASMKLINRKLHEYLVMPFGLCDALFRFPGLCELCFPRHATTP